MSTAPGLEGITLAKWLHARLAGDAQLRALLGGSAAADRVAEGVYGGTANTWVVFTVLPDFQDVKVVGATQVMARVRFQVKAVGEGRSYGPLVPIYQRVHALLESVTVPQVVAGAGTIQTCHRVSGIQYPERSDGQDFRHLGGLYEASIQ